jgi:hypothetical protein
MVGDRHSRHTFLNRRFHHLLDAARAVEQTVTRMEMKMYEWFLSHRANRRRIVPKGKLFFAFASASEIRGKDILPARIFVSVSPI